MSELVLKIGNSPDPTRYQDGDIIEAFNDNHIKVLHAEQLCHVRHLPFNSDGLNDLETIQEDFLKIMSEYRFERLNETTVQRTNQFTGEVDIISNIPNSKGEMMLVDKFLVKQKAFDRHRLFGKEGQEVWYGGVQDFSKINLVWDKIEQKTSNLRSNFTLMPLTPHEKKTFLTIPVSDFTSEEASEMQRAEMEEYVDEKGKEATRILQRRIHKVDYQIIFPEKVVDIQDSSKEVDLRLEISPLSKELIISTKLLVKDVKPK